MFTATLNNTLYITINIHCCQYGFLMLVARNKSYTERLETNDKRHLFLMCSVLFNLKPRSKTQCHQLKSHVTRRTDGGRIICSFLNGTTKLDYLPTKNKVFLFNQ